MRTSPNKITALEPNEIFVFGSNQAGRHGAGAAKAALQWGAVLGKGVGQFGQTYAIPTLDKYLMQLPLAVIQEYILDFIDFAEKNPKLDYLVTEIGCGIAGFSPAQIGPLFKDAKSVDNIYLPDSFWKYI